jgi:glycosyltransferase involved in cell wall biosynthesis
MISGTPVLVYAPKETAVSRFFSQNDCGYCLTSQSQGEIIKAIQFLISNEEYRKRISRNAVNLAKEKFDAEKVRAEFQNMMLNILPKKIYSN